MKKEIKLIAFDLDGTVLYNGSEITEHLSEILARALAQGIYVVPCTGRARLQLPLSLQKLGVSFTISANGARLIDESTDQTLYTNLIPQEMAEDIFRDVAAWGPFRAVHIDRHVYFETDDEAYIRKKYCIPDYMPAEHTDDVLASIAYWQQGIEKIYFRPADREERDQIRDMLLANYPILTSSSSANNLEVNIRSCCKGTALQWLCEYLGVDPSQVVAIGDSENDKEMLEFAGIGAAMGNGLPICKKTADVVIGTCEEDGAAEYLEQLLEG